MTLRSTHTFATLELSPAAYDEIADKLKEAGYGHAFIEQAIDMNGVGLVKGAETALPFSHIYRAILEWTLKGQEELNERTRARVRVHRGGISFRLDLRDCLLPTIGYRKTFPRSAAAEVAWFLLGTQDTKFIITYAPLWNKFIEEIHPDTLGVKSAYGHRWRKYFNRDQIKLAIDALRNNPSDRRCYVAAWDPAADGLGAKGQRNVPCPVGFSLSLLDGELHSTLTLRSSDVFVGLPYDVMGHALLMDAIALELEATPGVMHVALAHAHLYEHHWAMAAETLKQEPVVPSLALPGWSMEEITADPDAYVLRYGDAAKKHVWPSYNPKPFVVE